MPRPTSAAPAATPLREGGRPLAALLVLALLVKLAAALGAASTDPASAVPASDARYYLDRALGLAGASHDPLAGEPYHLPPLYPVVLSLVPGLAEGELAGVRMLQALSGTVLLLLVYLLARRRLSRGAALLATSLTLAYAPLTFYETQLLGDSLATTLLVGALVAADGYAAAAGSARPLAARAAGLGLLLALAALLRPQALLLVPAFALWAWHAARRAGRPGPWRPAAAALAAAALALLPSALHNARAEGGGPILVSDNGGVNFWLANEGPLSGSFLTARSEFGDIANQAAVAREMAERAEGEPLSAGEVSGWFLRQGLASVAADPARFAHRLVLRARALVESFEADVATFPAVQMRRMPPLLPLAMPFGVLLGLAVAARLLGARLRPAPAAPAWMLAAMVAATALLFFHYSRFRLPLVPLVAILAASGWDRLRAAHPPAGRAFAAATALLGVTALSVLPAPHHAPMRAAGLATEGWAILAGLQPGDRAGAEAALAAGRAALEGHPSLPRAQLLVARAALLLDDFDASATALDALDRLQPGHPPARLSRAWLLARRDPRNRHADPSRAREIAAELRRTAADDPQIRSGLDALEATLLRPR